MDGVVQAPVPAQRQAVDDAVAGGHLDRRGAVIGGETVPAGEPGHVTDVSDHGGGDDRADPEDPGQGRAGGPDRHRQLLPRLPQQGTGAAQAGHELGGQLGAGLLHRTAPPSPAPARTWSA